MKQHFAVVEHEHLVNSDKVLYAVFYRDSLTSKNVRQIAITDGETATMMVAQSPDPSHLVFKALS